ncbi:MAG: hypothetical protein H6706_30230 [Myxococcales bacterium]|nr:hypothetical protein [Myxococcales bacterium]
MRWPALALLLVGCGGDDPGEATPAPDQGVVARTCAERAAVLAAQCPPGSRPEVFAAGTTACAASGEILNDDGAIEAICRSVDGCVLVCGFTDPCACGIDRVTDEGVFCASCEEAAACGNQVCEGGESPETCPEDCGDVCAPGTERCAGEVREVCRPDGDWETVACRDDQACGLTRGRPFCQTRISPAGGTYLAPTGQPFAGDGDAAAIRFQVGRLPCAGDCEPLRFVEDGARVLARQGMRLALFDAATGAVEDAGFPVLGAFAVTEHHVGTSARQPIVVDRARRTTFTAQAIVDDTTGLATGGVALTEDGAELAVAMAVEGEPLVASWSTADGAARHLLRFVDPAVASNTQATALAFSPDGRLLAEGRVGGLVVLWNVAEGRYVHLLQTQVGEVTALAFPPTGEPVLLVGGAGLELWELEAARRRWREPRSAPGSLAISADGLTLAVGGGAVSLRRMADGVEIRALDGTGRVHFSPDGHRLLAGAILYGDAL